MFGAGKQRAGPPLRAPALWAPPEGSLGAPRCTLFGESLAAGRSPVASRATSPPRAEDAFRALLPKPVSFLGPRRVEGAARSVSAAWKAVSTRTLSTAVLVTERGQKWPFQWPLTTLGLQHTGLGGFQRSPTGGRRAMSRVGLPRPHGSQVTHKLALPRHSRRLRSPVEGDFQALPQLHTLRGGGLRPPTHVSNCALDAGRGKTRS